MTLDEAIARGPSQEFWTCRCLRCNSGWIGDAASDDAAGFVRGHSKQCRARHVALAAGVEPPMPVGNTIIVEHDGVVVWVPEHIALEHDLS